MSQPITVDIPHQLGREGARNRLSSRVGRVPEAIPGGGTVEHRWDGDTLHMALTVMGQRIDARAEVFDDSVRATIDLPGIMALMADPIRSAIEKNGPKLLA